MSHRAEFEISVLKDCEFRIVILFFSPLAEVPTLANPPRIFTGTSATLYISALRCRSHCQLAKSPSGGRMCPNNRHRWFFTPSSSRRRPRGSLCRRLALIIIPMPRRTLHFLGRPTRTTISPIGTRSHRNPKHSPAAVVSRPLSQAHLLHLPPSQLHPRLSLLSSSTLLLLKVLYRRCKISLPPSTWTVDST
jgi:hypothetical protein